MASPHSAGLVALLWSAKPDLVGDIEATEYAITSTAVCRNDTSCGGEACYNNVYGWGRIDASLAVQTVASAGILAGTVREAGSNDPLPGVKIFATGQAGFFRETSTDATGAYSLTLLAGPYTVSASLYAYYPQTVTGVLIVTDTTTIQNFVLQAKPRYVISGTVTEAGTGMPLEARITPEDSPIPSAWSDPATGFYSLTLVEGSYQVRAAAFLHLSERASVQADRNRTVNFVLEKGSCALLLDDDADVPDVRAYYTATLDVLGIPYRVWDVAQEGRPAPEDLLGHWLVFWWTGNDRGRVLSAEDEALLAGYLDSGGNLFLSSQDYIGQHLTDFQQNYLHVDLSFTTDTGQTDPVGNGSDPIGQGLGPYLLVPPPGWSGPLRTDDVTNDGFGGASSPFRWHGAGQDNSTDYDGVSFKTVFLAWPFEALSGHASRRAVLRAVLDFYGGCRPTGLLLGRVVDANSGEPLAGATIIPVPEGGVATAQPEETTNAQGHFTFTLPVGLYELTVYKPGYELEVLSAISVPAASIVRQEISLRTPRLAYAPASFSWTVPWEETATATLVLSNTGTAGPLEWALRIQGGMAIGRPALKAHAPAQRLAGQSPVDRPPPGLGLTVSPGPQGPGWTYEPPLPGGRCRSAAFSWEGLFYVMGGWGPYGPLPLDENLRYDPTARTWTKMASLPLSRTNMQAAVVEGIAYLPGGYSGYSYESSLLAYDIAANRWIEDRSPLPEPRSGAMVAAVHGLVYACGGWPGPSDRCWAYDPGINAWKEIAPMPDANGYGTAVEYEGSLYILGGVHSCSYYSCNPSRAFWRYDPRTNSWEEGPPLNNGRMSAAAVVYGGDLYVIGGGGDGGDIWHPYSTVERYSLSMWPAGAWEILPETVPTPVVAPAGGCTVDRIRIAGGSDERYFCRTDHQVLDEGKSCYIPSEGQLPWLTAEPLSGTLGIGERATVTLHVDAGMVPDPTCYAATLSIRNNTVYGVGRIPVTLCVVPTADLGLLTGTVRGLGYCDQEPVPLRTEVHIEGAGGLTWTVATDARGDYHRWLHAGTYTGTVGAPNYLTQTAVVAVGPAQTTTLNVDLRYLTPCLQLLPDQVTLYVPTGTQTQATLTLTNPSIVALEWQTQEALFPVGFFGPQGNAGEGWAGPMRSGGPDPFGYTFIDSAEPQGPTYSWIEVAWPENRLPIHGEEYATMTLPFTFTFYGVTYPPTTTLNISRYGYISLGGYPWLREECLPIASPNLLLPFWDWLYSDESGGLYAAVLGTSPHRALVIEWHEMLLGWPPSTVTFEAILFEGSNDIFFQYRDVTTEDPYHHAGAEATVGIQKDTRTYLQYSCNEAVLTDSLAICFDPPGSVPGCGAVWEDVLWVQVEPTSGQLPVDGRETVRLLLDTSGLQPGVYRAAVGLLSNDPRRPVVYVPVTLIVGLDRHVYLPLVFEER